MTRFSKQFKPAYIVIILLTIITVQTISFKIIFPNVPLRMQIQTDILSGNMEPPYQYRILKPYAGFFLEKVLSLFSDDQMFTHVLSYQIIIFVVFLAIFILFYFFLKLFFNDIISIIGLIFLYLVIPLGITSIWEEGDYYNLLFFLIGFNLMFRSKEVYLPLIMLAGVINRDQIIFLLVFYVCYSLSMNRLWSVRTLLILAASAVAWGAGYYCLRLIFGFKETKYTVEWNVSANKQMISQIIFLWSAMVIPFAALAGMAFKKSPKFFRLALLSLIVYVIIFFFNGFLTQLAKFLPAYLILIPMCLQLLKVKPYFTLSPDHSQQTLLESKPSYK